MAWHVITLFNSLGCTLEPDSVQLDVRTINRHEIRETMRINHIAEWYKKLWDDTPRRNGGASKLRTYRIIRYEYKIEPYLCNVRSCHPLRIETGRYHRPYQPHVGIAVIVLVNATTLW